MYMLIGNKANNESGRKEQPPAKILYVTEDKKRATDLLRSLRLQLPSEHTVLGSVGMITYPNGIVNIEGPNYYEWIKMRKDDNNDIRYSTAVGEDALDIGDAEQLTDEDLLWNMRMEDAPEYAQETLQEYKQLAAEKNRLQRKLNVIEADAEKKTGISAMSKRQLQAKIRQLENQVKQAREQTKRTAAKREARLKNIDASSVIRSVADAIANERTLSRYAKAELHQLYSDVLALVDNGDKGTARGDPL